MTPPFPCARAYQQRLSILCVAIIIIWALCISLYNSRDYPTLWHRLSRWQETTWEKLHWKKDHSLFHAATGCDSSRGTKCASSQGHILGLRSLSEGDDGCYCIRDDPLRPQLGTLDILSFNNDKRCLDRQNRFGPYQNSSVWQEIDFYALQRGRHTQRPHSAILLKAWDGFVWSADDVHNIRALFTETVLQSKGHYHLFILLHIRNPPDAIPGPGETIDDVKRRYVPEALVAITHIWTYNDVQSAYPKVGHYDYFDHALMSTQLFAHQHPEYEYFWNWEVDTRYTAHYGDLFTQSASWAKQQPLRGLSQRNTKYYIPGVDGSWEAYLDHTSAPRLTTQHATKSPSDSNDNDEAHLITFYPIFSTNGTTWFNSYRLYNYPPSIPRYGSIGLNARFSRQLLSLMAAENTAGRAMMAEMFAPTIASQHALKMVFVPHAMFLSRQPANADTDGSEGVDKVFNRGPWGQKDVLSLAAPRKWSTWSWDARFAGEVYGRWMGRVKRGEGSEEWERENGRICLPPLLLHPVKS